MGKDKKAPFARSRYGLRQVLARILWALREYAVLVRSDYSVSLFFLDLVYFFTYLFISPFALARKERGKNNVYGETPYTILSQIGRVTDLSPKTRYLELGSGRGKGVFFLRIRFGSWATGVVWVAPFVLRAQGIQRLFSLHKVDFRYGDLHRTSFEGADVVYVYSTCFTNEELEALARQANGLQKGAYIITVSVPLYPLSASLTLEKRFLARFPWGKTEVYIQKKR